MAINDNQIIVGLLIILAIAAIGLIGNLSTQNFAQITGFDTQTSISSVTVQSYISLSKSTNFTDGIKFGSVNQGTNNNNASANYNSTSHTLYDIAITDSNCNVDFCISASLLNTTGGSEIGLGNYTWNDSAGTIPIGNNVTNPDFSGKQAMPLTGSGVNGSQNVLNGTSNYYRFWLTIPVSQAPGTYNNTVSMEGYQTGGAGGGCTI